MSANRTGPAGEGIRASYPQMPPLPADELQAFINDTPIARLCTHNPEGTIHVSPVWFRLRNRQILVGTQDVSRKVRNIKRDNRVTVEVDSTEWPFKGALIYGRADLDYDDAVGKRVFINEKYVGREEAERLVQRLARNWKQVVIRVTPERIVSFDYS